MHSDFHPGQPFVSISAVTSLDELKDIARIKDQLKPNFPVVIGWQLSSSSINDGTQNSRQPPFHEIKNLYKAALDNDIVSAFHYYTKDMNSMEDDLEILANKLNFFDQVKLLQFNTLPPSEENLEVFRGFGFSPILKVPIADKRLAPKGYQSHRVNDIRQAKADDLHSQARSVSGLINYVMFDPSHGVGLELGTSKDNLGIHMGHLITSDLGMNRVGLVYAGGIGPNNARNILSNLKRNFPRRVSIDSQSAIRTQDRLDSNKVKEYLTEVNLAWNS